MVRGLDHFRAYFRSHSENFILVGGVASYLLLDEAGAPKLRPTKDLDIVLIMKPSEAFLKALKEYIKAGGYEIQRGNKDQATFYRFQRPQEDVFPVMIELFATAEADFDLVDGQHIIPITNPDGVESLSAILLDEEYYAIIKKNAVEKDGIYISNDRALIPFKAKAYLEIKARGGDSREWKKHRGDIINLAVALLSEQTKEKLSGKMMKHFQLFLSQLELEINDEVVNGACGQKIKAEIVLNLLRQTFL